MLPYVLTGRWTAVSETCCRPHHCCVQVMFQGTEGRQLVEDKPGTGLKGLEEAERRARLQEEVLKVMARSEMSECLLFRRPLNLRAGSRGKGSSCGRSDTELVRLC